jgi:hypothetical protein
MSPELLGTALLIVSACIVVGCVFAAPRFHEGFMETNKHLHEAQEALEEDFRDARWSRHS